MELDSFLLADAASVADGKLYVHGGGITRIAAPELPWVHPQLAIVIRLRLDPDDLQDKGATLQVRLFAPDGSFVVPNADVPLPAGQRTPKAEGEEGFAQVVLTVAPVPFEREGTYLLEVALDGRPIREMRIPVVLQENVPQ